MSLPSSSATSAGRRARRFRSPRAVATLAVALAAGLALPMSADAVPADSGEPVQVVHVEADTQAERSEVASLGLDLTEHGDATGVGVVLHSEKDRTLLRNAGFTWTVEDPDLGRTMRLAAEADTAYARRTHTSPLPSGRTSYRTLDDVNAEINALARRWPGLVKPITLPNPSGEGRRIRGMEITRNVTKTDDGKPVFLLMGAHHAREWPSVEHSMEFAYDLLLGYNKHDPRRRAILTDARIIIIPVVNVDGFVVSRSAPTLGDFSQFDYEMKRKDCGISANTPAQYRTGSCDENPAGRLRGTDLNRNYPGFWGGPGASFNWSGDTYRGDAPGDTPEVDNIRRLVSTRQVTVLISNHTFSNLVLRPPSLYSTGWAPDEPQYKALGAQFTQANNYVNQASFQLYDTSGSTEDWSYWQTGGYGFTFEIGPDSFHPPYETGVVAEYLGRAPAAGAGLGGNREAYLRAAEAAADPAFHSTITGNAPANRTITVSKSFTSTTSPVIQPDGTESDPIVVDDELSTSLRTKGGAFSMAVNPSTRPYVAGNYGRDPLAPTQPTVALTNPDGIPATMDVEETTFTIGGLPEYDNGTAEVRVGWGDADVDWDIFVYDSQGRQVGSAATLDDPERALLIDPTPGEYTLVVQNYSGGETADWTGEVVFSPPTPAAYTGVKESWNLTCALANGKVVTSVSVEVDRGESVDVGRVCRENKKDR